jgi:hypothetical protein
MEIRVVLLLDLKTNSQEVRMKTPVKIISLTLLLFALMSNAWAQIPRTISYQGVLADAAGNIKPDDDYAFIFRLYETSNGGNAIWTETKTLAVKRGLFSTALGDQTMFGANVKFDKPYWLSIQVGNEAELPQRIALSSSAYSLNSLKAEVAADVAEGQVVKSINALKDDVTLEGAGGATVTSVGGKITISAAGGSGSGIQGVQNTDNTLDITNPNGPTASINLKSPLNLQGNVGIGTATPHHRLAISGGPLWTSYSWSGSLELNNGAAIGWNTNDAGQRFGMGHSNTGFYFFRTASDPGTTASPPDYDMVINDVGNVGIGTFAPTSKLEIAGQDALKITGYQPLLTFQDSNEANARGRIQSVSGGLNFFTESYMSGANPYAFLVLNNNGNVGIGSSHPANDRLEIVGQNALGMIGYQPFLTFYDTNAGYARGRIQSANGVLGFETEVDIANRFPASVEISSAPNTSRLLVRAQDGLNTVGYQPFLTLTDANAGYARSRIQGVEGNVFIAAESYMSGANPRAFLNLHSASGNVGVGEAFPQTKLDVNGTTRTKVLSITGGADMAEPFETTDSSALEPGAVMVIDVRHPGKLVMSASAYDRRVAGIVSGAGGVKAGITLQHEGVMEGDALIAIAGRVYCQAEADSAPIEPGDLLTTSNIPGRAMKAVDDSRSHGAIIGKAMSALKQGRGLVLVLVNLQ